MAGRAFRIDMPVLLLQLLVALCCLYSLWLFATNFPYPSPLIKPLLSPEQRWPTQQVKDWVARDDIPKGFLAFFGRDPERDIPAGDNIVAPADGLVRDIIHDQRWTYIDIALSFWDVHVQRSPVAGVITTVAKKGDRFMNGEYKNMVFLKDKMAPVQKTVDIETDEGMVKVRLVTSLNARRIRVWVHRDEQVKKGQRIGRILLGSTVILQLPPGMSLAVEKGQRVVAGETVIASGALP